MHMNQVENPSHVSQQCCVKDWVDVVDGGKLTPIEWFSFDKILSPGSTRSKTMSSCILLGRVYYQRK